MAIKASATLNITPIGGSPVAIAWDVDAPGLDVNRGTVKAAADGASGSLTLALQPSSADKVAVLVIKAGKYTDKLKVNVTGAGDEFYLTTPVIVTNPDVIKKIHNDPKQFTFTNADTEDIDVDMLALRFN